MSESLVKQSQVDGLAASLSGKQATLVSGTNIKTVNGTSLLGSGDITISGGGGGSTEASNVSYTNAFTSIAATDVQEAITELDTEKQPLLVSGTSIKTINGSSLLGSGNLVVSGTGGVTADEIAFALTETATTKRIAWNSLDEPTHADAGDDSCLFIQRRAVYTGGTVGKVNSALYVQTFTPATTHGPFEWGFTSELFSSSIVSGSGASAAPQNVAINGTAWKSAGNSPIWAGNFAAYDAIAGTYSAGRGPLHGIEVNVGIEGTDSGENTIGVFIVPQASKGASSASMWTGMLVSGSGSINWRNGITVRGGGVFGYFDEGAHAVAIDLSTATNSVAAIRLKTGDAMHFDATSQSALRYSGSGVPGLTYSFGGVDKHVFADDGTYVMANTIAIPASKLSYSAAAGAYSLPANPVAFVSIIVGGTSFKVPLYG